MYPGVDRASHTAPAAELVAELAEHWQPHTASAAVLSSKWVHCTPGSGHASKMRKVIDVQRTKGD